MANKKNESSIKIFQFLKLLYEDDAYYDKVIDIFKDDLKKNQSTNTIQVILNKYINTFKVFGMNVIKEKGKFKLLSSIYSMDFSLDDIKSLSILASSIKKFPDETLNKELLKFLSNIMFRMNKEDKMSFENIIQNNHYDFSFQYLDLKEQIKKCRELCNSNQNIIVFYLKNSKEVKTKCTPKEILYDSKNAYFKLYDQDTKQNIEIPMSKILRIEVLPQKAKANELPQTVVYKLTGRLAKTYKLKQNENTDETTSDSITIINRGEPTEELFRRLMRYADCCEIISPKNLRYDFLDLINKTLNIYEDDEE